MVLLHIHVHCMYNIINVLTCEHSYMYIEVTNLKSLQTRFQAIFRKLHDSVTI